MVLRGPKLEMRQLILGRLVDIGAELAVMALTISRFQTEEKISKSTTNRDVVEHFILSRRKVVERLFDDVWNNSDETASRAAKSIMESADHLPRRGDLDLPATERKFCSDYTK
jgi:ribosome recycling factor